MAEKGFFANFSDGFIKGDFAENDSWGATFGQITGGLLPIYGQAADLRDLGKAGMDLWNGKEGALGGLGAAALGVVPLVGDGAKAALKGGGKLRSSLKAADEKVPAKDVQCKTCEPPKKKKTKEEEEKEKAEAAKAAAKGEPLANADKAVIDRRKLDDYALNPDHPVGGNKARVFDSALGYNRSNSAELMGKIQEGVRTQPAAPGLVDNFGTRYSVDIPMSGPSGGSATVRTGWIVRPGSTAPELTTTFVK